MASQDKSHLPIDRGWAWVIVLATAGVFSVVAGGYKSQGILLVELQERYADWSASSLLWVFSLSSLANKLTGPLNSYIIMRTSHRTVTMIGLFMMSISLLGSAYAPSAIYLYPIYGIVYGLGAGMVSLSAFTAFGPYFNKRKALAMGLAAAGSGFGTMIMPNMLRALFDNFGFTGALIVYAGYVMQFLVLAVLLRPLSFYEELHRRGKIEEESAKETDIDTRSQGAQDTQVTRRTRSVSANVRDQHRTNAELFTSMPNKLEEAHSLHAPEQLATTDILYSMTDVSAYGSKIFTHKDEAHEPAADTVGALRQLFQVARMPKIIMAGLSILLYTCGIAVAFTCIPPLGKASGVDKKTISLVLSISGAVEIPCRVFQGWVADRHIVSAITQYTFCVITCGLAAIVCATASGLPGITTMLVSIGAVGTTVYSLSPIVLAELGGKECVTPGMGILYFYQGVAFCISTPLAGVIYERTGEWENVFYYIGAAMILGGAVTGAYAIRTHHNKKLESRAESKLFREGDVES